MKDLEKTKKSKPNPNVLHLVIQIKFGIFKSVFNTKLFIHEMKRIYSKTQRFSNILSRKMFHPMKIYVPESLI